ncbi:hypothetical protein [Flavobacterium succinicans]|uniref:YD repeat-containing protein n=1 Tax=Flavobacterium succinicans TaxID=29536 RepID=A0A199XVR5_9FLAO|nr:hypothetical protein [Flavobacterium succinicans]OAZ05336.1 hypothetical protein FLB_02240 [Flavobacterium succinicans]
MKKLLSLLGATLLVLASCSTDDTNSSNPTASILVKKMSTVNNGKTYTQDFTYSGNKIVSTVDSDGNKTAYTYTGDFITKIVDTDNKGAVDYTIEFSYTNSKLTSKTTYESGAQYKYRTKYVHNTDGTISYEEFRTAVATGVEQEYGYIGKYTYKGGNLIKNEYLYYGSENTASYEYDTKNTPFKNVLGFNLLLEEDMTSNNIVKITYSKSKDVISNTYIYNADGFPTEQKGFYNGALIKGPTTFIY